MYCGATRVNSSRQHRTVNGGAKAINIPTTAAVWSTWRHEVTFLSVLVYPPRSIARGDTAGSHDPDICAPRARVGGQSIDGVSRAVHRDSGTSTTPRRWTAADDHPGRSAVDIVVVNGGAPDDRLNAICRRPDLQLLTSPPGRGRQMKSERRLRLAGGIRVSARRHAVTAQWSDEIRRASADPMVVGGSFRFRLDSTAWQRG